MATISPQVSDNISHPRINSIPSHLTPRSEPAYNPNAYLISNGRALVPQGKLEFTKQAYPVSGCGIIAQIFEPDEQKYPVKDEGRPVYVHFHGGG
ncbi:hypothetical protein JHW43_004996 [Diplocarpon mali]|nr:hypothetical protein JHW43_004996 [Diplocarpon mali]